MSTLSTSRGSAAVNWEWEEPCVVARGQTADSQSLSDLGGRCGGGGVLTQRVAACRVEATLRGRWAPPIELAGCVTVWVGGWSSRHDSRLFVRAFVRSIRSRGSLPNTEYANIWFALFVCVRVRSCSITCLPGLGTNAPRCVMVKRSLLILTTTTSGLYAFGFEGGVGLVGPCFFGFVPIAYVLHHHHHHI